MQVFIKRNVFDQKILQNKIKRELTSTLILTSTKSDGTRTRGHAVAEIQRLWDVLMKMGSWWHVDRCNTRGRGIPTALYVPLLLLKFRNTPSHWTHLLSGSL